MKPAPEHLGINAWSRVIDEQLTRQKPLSEAGIELAVFETREAGEIAALTDEFCRRWLGAGIAHYRFFSTSVSSVHGVELTDGRRVVVKARTGDADTDHLVAVQRIQGNLHGAGFPCPRPVLGPTPLRAGVAVVEELLDSGSRGAGRQPPIRQAIARSLARQVELCRPLVSMRGLRPGFVARLPEQELWLTPHEERFDFASTAWAAEWIDALAAEARALMNRGRGDLVIGHCDWRAEHLRFSGGEVVAAYDWDSLGVLRETDLVAAAAHVFTADWSGAVPCVLPSPDESEAFVVDYEAARGRRFDEPERATIDAVLVYSWAYAARCALSDVMTAFGTRPPKPPPSIFAERGRAAVLAGSGPELLKRAARHLDRARRVGAGDADV